MLFISYRSESTSEVGLLGRDQVMRRTTKAAGCGGVLHNLFMSRHVTPLLEVVDYVGALF